MNRTAPSQRWRSSSAAAAREISEPVNLVARRPPLILALREEHRSTITDRFGRAAGSGHRVLEYLYEHPIVSAKQVLRLIDTSYPAANDLVARMVDCGILREFTGRVRNRMFMYQDYIDLFHETEGV